jgi:hypothetical protein
MAHVNATPAATVILIPMSVPDMKRSFIDQCAYQHRGGSCRGSGKALAAAGLELSQSHREELKQLTPALVPLLKNWGKD